MITPPVSQRVWDPIIRIGHWVIVIGFFTAYLSGDEWFSGHKWAGYIVASVVLIRIVWGFVGPKHARFSNFVKGPGATLSYLLGLFSGKAKRHLGHNPTGGVMIVALLFSLAGTTGSGMALYASEDGKGPLAPFISADNPALVLSYSDDDEDEHEEEGEEALEEVHEAFTYLTLLLVALHVVGVVASSLAHKENLVAAMITGRKRVEPGDGT